jgi:hypothetical protein
MTGNFATLCLPIDRPPDVQDARRPPALDVPAHAAARVRRARAGGRADEGNGAEEKQWHHLLRGMPPVRVPTIGLCAPVLGIHKVLLAD